jgi:hypothetical protein
MRDKLAALTGKAPDEGEKQGQGGKNKKGKNAPAADTEGDDE